MGKSQGSARPECNASASPWEICLGDHGVSRDEDRAVRRLAAPCRLQLLPQHRIGLALGSVRAPPPPGPSAFCFACDAGSSSSACGVSSPVSITTSAGEAEGPWGRGPVLLALGLAQRVLCEQGALQGGERATRRLRLSLGDVEGTGVLGLLYSEWGTLTPRKEGCPRRSF